MFTQNQYVFIIPAPSSHTHPANEAIGMPLAVKCGNVIFHDGAIASSTFGGEHVEVVVATVGLSFTLMETVLSKLFTALGAEEVVHVPGFF